MVAPHEPTNNALSAFGVNFTHEIVLGISSTLGTPIRPATLRTGLAKGKGERFELACFAGARVFGGTRSVALAALRIFWTHKLGRFSAQSARGASPSPWRAEMMKLSLLPTVPPEQCIFMNVLCPTPTQNRGAAHLLGARALGPLPRSARASVPHLKGRGSRVPVPMARPHGASGLRGSG